MNNEEIKFDNGSKIILASATEGEEIRAINNPFNQEVFEEHQEEVAKEFSDDQRTIDDGDIHDSESELESSVDDTSVDDESEDEQSSEIDGDGELQPEESDSEECAKDKPESPAETYRKLANINPGGKHIG